MKLLLDFADELSAAGFADRAVFSAWRVRAPLDDGEPLIRKTLAGGPDQNFTDDAGVHSLFSRSLSWGNANFSSDLAVGHAIADYSMSGATFVKTASYVQGLGVDTKWVKIDAGGAAHFYLPDALGSVSRIVNAAGVPEETRLTTAWGEGLLPSGADRHGFTQREADPESSLMYYRARTYDPRIGRFTSPDPLPGSRPFSHFAYGLNSPLSFVDPDGRQEIRIRTTRFGLQLLYEYEERGWAAFRSWRYTDVGVFLARSGKGIFYRKNERAVEATLTSIRARVSQGFLYSADAWHQWAKERRAGILMERAQASVKPKGSWGEVRETGVWVGAVQDEEDRIHADTLRLAVNPQAEYLVEEFLSAIEEGTETALVIAGSVLGAWALSEVVAILAEPAQPAVQLVRATAHGSKRLTGWAQAEIRAALNSGRTLTQADGARVHLLEISPGRFNVLIEGRQGVITAWKNMPQKALDEIGKRYGWK